MDGRWLIELGYIASFVMAGYLVGVWRGRRFERAQRFNDLTSHSAYLEQLKTRTGYNH